MQSFRIATVLVAVVLSGGLASAQSLIVSQGQTIAFSGLDGTPDGDVAPGLLMGERFGGPNGPNPGAIDDSGRVLFRAQLVNSAGVAYPSAQQYLSRGYFLGDSRGNLALVLRGGDPDPSGTIPGATLKTDLGGVALTGTPRISSSGLIMFGSTISDGGVTITTGNDSVLYGGTAANWQILAREGSVAPSCGGATFNSDFSGMAYAGTAINAAGQIAFQSTLAGTGVVTANDAAWFTGSIGNVQLMLRKGDFAPGGEQVSAIGNSTHMNAAGQVLIEVTFLLGSGANPVTSLNDKALWVYTPGVGFAEILREGGAAPVPGTFYSSPSLSGVSIFNGAGQALVSINNLLLLASPSSTSVVMANLDAAPGVPGANFNAVTAFNMCLTDGGTVAFNASLVNGGVTVANDSGLWTGTAGNLTLVAREGNVAPGSGGQTFGHFSGNIFLNAAGQVLFSNALSGGGNAQSTFSWDPVLGLQPVFFSNDSVEVQPGVFRTLIQSASAPNSNSSGSRPLCFANDGTVTLRPSFSDGSWGIVTVRVGSLTGLPKKISEVTGGTHKLYLNAGPAHAGQLYAVAGSASGTNPGTPIGAFIVPLNLDAYTDFTLANANVGPFVNTLGTLGATTGRALAQIVIPPLPGAAGLVVHHAYGVLDAFNNLVFVSEAARLEITP